MKNYPAVFGVLCALFFVSIPASTFAATLGPNLIPNPSLESAEPSGLPTGWLKGGYGTNTRTLTYPVAGYEGAKAAEVSISSYTSGDAKWYFTPLSVSAGTAYQFSDYSKSDVASEIDVQFKKSDGTFSYAVLAHPAPSSTFQQTVAQFTVPANVVSLTIFHTINRMGTLTVDSYALQEVTPDSNLVQNGDFEMVSATAGPLAWRQGGWGSNTRTFTYPVGGANGKGAQVSITSYSGGDAKWYFLPIELTPGRYIYSDDYKSDIPSLVVVQFHKTSGAYSYTTIGVDSASPNFTSQSIGFVVPPGTQDVTVFHLIQGVGTLTIDNVRLLKSTYSNGVFANGGVTLTFDNGWLSHYQTAMPMMNVYDFKGTFYIITHELADYGYPGFVSKDQIKQMAAGGQEIGSHTKTHAHLTQLTPAEQEDEIAGSRQELLAMNVGPIDSFAYPFGEYDASSLQKVKNAGYTNARTTITGDAVPTSDPYQLPRMLVLNSTTPAQIEQWIDDAIAEKSWLILEFHQVDDSGAMYAITPANFGTIIDYLAAHNVDVVTMEEGYQSLSH